MKKFWFAISPYLLLLNISCERMDNSIESLNFECGKDARPGFEYIKLLTADNNNITQINENLYAFHSEQLTVDQSESTASLKLTEKGCVDVSGLKSGRVDVFTKVPREGNSISISNRQRSKLQKIVLEPIEDNPLQLICPNEGYIASTNLSALALRAANASDLVVRYKISISEEDGVSPKLIAVKDFGEVYDIGMTDFDLSKLPRGRYKIRSKREVIDNRNQLGLTAELDSTCDLTLLEENPATPSELSAITDGSVFALESVINWPLNAYYQTRFCKSTNPEHCRDTRNFRPVVQIKNDQAGPWSYCFFSTQIGGGASDISCRSIRVSGKAPDLGIALDSDALNSKLKILDFPAMDLRFKLRFSHAQLTKEELAKALQCKVEIAAKGSIVFGSQNAVCMSKSCFGKSLEEFVPCDEEMQVDISRIYTSDTLDKMELKFIARIDDGAGNSVTSSESILIDKNRLKYSEITGPGTSLPEDKILMILPIVDQNLEILAEGGKIYRYSFEEAKWKLESDLNSFQDLFFSAKPDFIVLPNRTVVLHWGGQVKSLILAKEPGAKWSKITTNDGYEPACKTVQSDYWGTLSCITKDSYLEFIGDQWVNRETAGMNQFPASQYLRSEKFEWKHSNGKLYSRGLTEKNWSERLEIADVYFDVVLKDRESNIWIRSNEWEDDFVLGYFDVDGRWNDAVKDTTIEGSAPISILSLSTQGEIRFGGLGWDRVAKDWVPLFPLSDDDSPGRVREYSIFDTLQRLDGSVAAEIGNERFLLQFPKDKWQAPLFQSNIEYREQSREFFILANKPGSDIKQVVRIGRRNAINLTSLYTDNSQSEDFDLYRQEDGSALFRSKDQKIYEILENGLSEVYYQPAKLNEAGEKIRFSGIPFRISRDVVEVINEQNETLVIKRELFDSATVLRPDNGSLWVLQESKKLLLKVSPQDIVHQHSVPAACLMSPNLSIHRNLNQIYIVSGKNICVANLEDMLFKVVKIDGFEDESEYELISQLSDSQITFAKMPYEEGNKILLLDLDTLQVAPLASHSSNLRDLLKGPDGSIFGAFDDRIEILIDGNWRTLFTSEQVSSEIEASPMEFMSLVIDQDDSLLLQTTSIPLIRFFYGDSNARY